MYERHIILSSVLYSRIPPENLWEVLKKVQKFMYFWAEIHKIHVVLGPPYPLVANNFSSVEICDFHSTKHLIKAINFKSNLLK